MIRLFRWLLRSLVALIALTAISGLGLYWFLSRSIPDYGEIHDVAGLDGAVEIVRDNANVPHIFGVSDRDVFYGLGFAHAQDRLWQMTMLRRTAQGRLSELFGLRTVGVDVLMRRLDLYNLAVASLPAQDAYTLAALEAYSDGVNAWLAEVNEGAKGRGAPEFWVFPPEIAFWDPADSLAIVKLMALDLASHLDTEVLRARASLLLSADRVADILPDVPGDGIAALPEFAALVPGTSRQAAASASPRMLDPFLPGGPRGLSGASNAWAAAPGRSAAGSTLLANDPHLRFRAPGIWYLARLELGAGGVIGGTIPGVPVVLAGRSSGLGWAITSAYADDQDLFIERLNPENDDEVLGPDGWVSIRKRPSIIQIKDNPPLTIILQWSPNGPILLDDPYDLDTITPEGHVPALSWTALSPDDTSLSSALGIMRAGSVDAAIDAGSDFIAPALNLTLVDRDRIAMKLIGALPRRSQGHQSFGRLPTPGWVAENRWQGRLPYAENPVFLDPDGGIIGNTNNKTVDRPFPNHVSFDWGDTQRIERWRRLMQAREVHTRESFIEAQLDTVSFSARSLLPLVGRELWFTGEAAPEGTPERRRQQALSLLVEWNGEMNEHLPEPLIYAAWMRELQARLIRDEMGPLARAFIHLEPLFIERVFRDIDGAAAWCDVIQSAPVETCEDMARIALDEALIWIDARYGGDLAALRWGDAHEATHDHQVLGDTPWLRWVVNIRQSVSGGDHTLQRGRTLGREPDPFLSVHGAGYRGVYDFADPDSSVFIVATGQSGHPLSRHYDDLGEFWRRGEYIPMSLDPDLARAAAVGITRLEPR
ncbi:MAG: penicillin acylase family protein [Pseudomonadota bacterium]